MQNHVVKEKLISYYSYLDERIVNGYSSTSMTSEFCNCSGGNAGGSIIPKGVDMTDVKIILFINKMDMAITTLIHHDVDAYLHIKMRYQDRLSVAHIASELSCCERTCRRRNCSALQFIGQLIC